MSTTLSNKVYKTRSQKGSNWTHPIFFHQRVQWCHCCHSNLGFKTTGRQHTETPTRVGIWVNSKNEGIQFVSSKMRMWWNNILLCCYEDKPVPFIQPDSYKRLDGVRCLRVSFLFWPPNPFLTGILSVSNHDITVRLNGSAPRTITVLICRRNPLRKTLAIQAFCNYVFTRWHCYYRHITVVLTITMRLNHVLTRGSLVYGFCNSFDLKTEE